MKTVATRFPHTCWLLLVAGFLVSGPATLWAADDLDVELVAPPYFLAGEHLALEARLKNKSDNPLTLVKPIDGCTRQRRYPHITILGRTEAGTPMDLKYGVGDAFVNPMKTNDLVVLAPGGSTQVYVGWPYGNTSFTNTARFDVCVVFNLAAPNMTSWAVPGRLAGNKQNKPLEKALLDVPAICVTSKYSRVEIKPLTEVAADGILLRHFREDAIRKDYRKGKWWTSDIRHFQGRITFLLRFEKGYVPASSATIPSGNARFTEGRYLLFRKHSLRRARRDTVEDLVFKHYDLFGPGVAEKRVTILDIPVPQLGFPDDQSWKKTHPHRPDRPFWHPSSPPPQPNANPDLLDLGDLGL